MLFFLWSYRQPHPHTMFTFRELYFVGRELFTPDCNWLNSQTPRLMLCRAHVSRVLLSLCQLSSGGCGADNHGPADGPRQWCQVLCKHPPLQYQTLWRCNEHSFLHLLTPDPRRPSCIRESLASTACHSGQLWWGLCPANSFAGASCLLPIPVVLRVKRKYSKHYYLILT